MKLCESLRTASSGRAARASVACCSSSSPTARDLKGPDSEGARPVAAESDHLASVGEARHATQPLNTCRAWLPRKKRFCKFPAKPGKQFCGNHAGHGAPPGTRMLCPYDPNQCASHDSPCHQRRKGERNDADSRTLPLCSDCLVEELERHLAKCPSCQHIRAQRSKPFYLHNTNSGDTDETSLHHDRLATSSARAAHARHLGVAGMRALIQRIHAAAAEVGVESEFPPARDIPPSCEAFLKPASDHHHTSAPPVQPKHALQQAAIVGNLARLGLARDPADVFVELGAGKGYLTLMLARSTCACNFVLNDVSTFRLKADRALRAMARDSVKDVAFVRCQADLKDFSVDGAVESLRLATCASAAPRPAGCRHVVTLGKHLCGAATDYALRASLQAGCHDAESSAPLRGLCIATCCHHRCSWNAYVGKEALQSLGFSAEEFSLISYMAGEANCGGSEADGLAESVSQEGDSDAKVTRPFSLQSSQGLEHSHARGGACEQKPGDVLSRNERMEVGAICKRLIDYGRIQWLQSHGMHADIVCYVEAAISGENRLLCARRAAP